MSETPLEFTDQLKSWCETPSGPYRRPFRPNATWQTAQVFVIGTNPATPLRDEFASFDEYWKSLTFCPEIFERHYSAKHGGSTSKTARWTNELLCRLRPLNCLLTNVSWYPASKPSEVPKAEWAFGRCALRALIGYCRPRVLFCHGKPAETFARELGASVHRYAPAASQGFLPDGTLVFAFHHLSGQGLPRGARFEPATELPLFAQKIKLHVGDP